MKLKKDWSAAEDIYAFENSRDLNAIYNGFDKNIFGIINTCISVKEALGTLEVAHEDTFKVSMSKLQLIIRKVEKLKM